MVSFYLLHRGLSYFTLSGANFLPLLKHAMDLHLTNKWANAGCKRPVFRYTCFDDFGSDFTYKTELGCASVIFLLTLLILTFHTALAAYHFATSCYFVGTKNKGFLAGTEFGCCGLAAVVISVATDDREVDDAAGVPARFRRHTRLITAALQVPLIIAACVAMDIVTDDWAWDTQRTSLWVFLVVLMLNLSSFVENIYEGFIAGRR
ncbi:hypothetical protein PhCBS80983_g03104 [Powellomyces hirtus]|uniref:Uncharacterized protein n=1 Tax=Powellomyces hirtus TaxID=109895 RepID=A0A507E5F7_9FUNG|nr:hypothetical protein PhCBS80983_g03104 [Powellomyces hirtus]